MLVADFFNTHTYYPMIELRHRQHKTLGRTENKWHAIEIKTVMVLPLLHCWLESVSATWRCAGLQHVSWLAGNMTSTPMRWPGTSAWPGRCITSGAGERC